MLVQRMPKLSTAAKRARSLVEQIASDPSVNRVEQIAERSGLGVRALQRLFAHYVGVSPKWVVLRYRLHEALARIDSALTARAVTWISVQSAESPTHRAAWRWSRGCSWRHHCKLFSRHLVVNSERRLGERTQPYR